MAEMANAENYLEIIKALAANHLLDTVASIVDAYDSAGEPFDTYLLEKPWKFPEIWVPALNGEIGEKLPEILEG